jgi:hypothetical protein
MNIMNKYAKQYISSFANVISQKVATELKLNEMVNGGKAVFNFLSDPFKDAYSNARDAKQLYAAGQPEAAKAKNYQALGNLAMGGAGLIPVGRGITWGSKMITGGVNTARPLLRSLSNKAMTGGYFGGSASSGFGDTKYRLLWGVDQSPEGTVPTPQARDIIQHDLLKSDPRFVEKSKILPFLDVNTDSFKEIQRRPINERISFNPHLDVLGKMRSGYNPE